MIDLVIRNMVSNAVSNLHSCMICRVSNVNPLSVTPIHKKILPDGSSEDYPTITGVRRVGGYKYTTSSGSKVDVELPLVNGDLVVVIFCDRAIDGSGTRKHHISDAIIVGKLV